MEKTEKQKMLAGELYFAFDEELCREREMAKGLVYELNHLAPSEHKRRTDLFVRLLGKTGQHFIIESPFYCDYGYNIRLGENFYANVGCTILDVAPVSIGDNVLLAPHVGIYTAGHPTDAELRKEGLEYGYPVTIGNNVWIGGNTVILPGVTVGDNVVIGAGSVVTKDIPSGVVAVGNPCRVIKEV